MERLYREELLYFIWNQLNAMEKDHVKRTLPQTVQKEMKQFEECDKATALFQNLQEREKFYALLEYFCERANESEQKEWGTQWNLSRLSRYLNKGKDYLTYMRQAETEGKKKVYPNFEEIKKAGTALKLSGFEIRKLMLLTNHSFSKELFSGEFFKEEENLLPLVWKRLEEKRKQELKNRFSEEMKAVLDQIENETEQPYFKPEETKPELLTFWGEVKKRLEAGIKKNYLYENLGMDARGLKHRMEKEPPSRWDAVRICLLLGLSEHAAVALMAAAGYMLGEAPGSFDRAVRLCLRKGIKTPREMNAFMKENQFPALFQE